MVAHERRVLAIANRAEIAIRVARTARKLGWQPVALLGEPDLTSLAAREVGTVEPIGPAGSELNVQAVVQAALRVGATALHPGYGFLSEREELSRACRDAGITFIGPTPETLAICGDKIATRDAALSADVPTLPASDPLTLEDEARWRAEADRIGYPLIAKVAGGGGGRGLRVATDPSSLDDAVRSALREAGVSGAGTRLYLERYLSPARHVEVQVAGNGADAVALGDRDCSIQRRHQKVVEEAPALALSDELRARLHEYATAMAKAVRLLGVGTVEFLLQGDDVFFIEVNPRLQVEHTVTEEVTGLDLIEVQLSLAFGGAIPSPVKPHGHAIQARIYAEDPFRSSIPTPGLLTELHWPGGARVRVDAGYSKGDTIPTAYDAMVGKVIAWGRDRDQALDRLCSALTHLRADGVSSPDQPIMTNQPWLLALLDEPSFRNATHTLDLAGAITVAERAPTPDELAPAVRTILTQSLDGATAWSSSGPFRITRHATLILHGGEAGGWEHRFEVGRSKESEAWIASSGETDDVVMLDASAATGSSNRSEMMTIISPRGRWSIETGPLLSHGAAGELTDGTLRAPMPGTVTAIHVTAGQQVSKGDVVLVMVAMKIEMAMAAPFDGIVERVDCAVGDLVDSRQALATVTPEGKGAPDE